MSQLKIKQAIIAGAVLATSLAVRDSIYSLMKKYFPLPEDEFFANMITALVSILLLFLILWLSTFYVTPEEATEAERKRLKIEQQKQIAKSVEMQSKLQAELALRSA